MNAWLDGIATWFAGIGIHPLLGALTAGLVVGLLARSRRGGADGAPTEMTFSSSAARTRAGAAPAVATGSIPLEPRALTAVTEKIATGHMVEAIKLVRTHTGLGLTESKQLVDAVARSTRPH